jgi:hypothetical protein
VVKHKTRGFPILHVANAILARSLGATLCAFTSESTDGGKENCDKKDEEGALEIHLRDSKQMKALNKLKERCKHNRELAAYSRKS